MKQRIQYVDFFRGGGILLMVMGHIGFGAAFDKLIHGFHMPMFFFISGFMYKHKDMNLLDTVRKKAKSLLLPYAVFGLLFLLIDIVKNGFDIEHILNVIWKPTDGVPIAGALWFLMAMFISDVIYDAVDKTIASNGLRIAVIGVIALIGCFARRIIDVTLPFALSAAMVGAGLKECGRQAKGLGEKYRINNRIISGSVSIAVFLVGMLIVWYNGNINMRQGQYANVLLFWISAVAICCSLLSLSFLWIDLGKLKLINSVVCSIGEESIVYLCLNEAVIAVLIALRDKLVSVSVVSQVAVLVLTMLVLYVISKLVMRTKLRIIFGKK